VGTTVTRAASERNTHENNTLNSVCSKQYKIKNLNNCFKKQIFFKKINGPQELHLLKMVFHSLCEQVSTTNTTWHSRTTRFHFERFT